MTIISCHNDNIIMIVAKMHALVYTGDTLQAREPIARDNWDFPPMHVAAISYSLWETPAT